MRATVINYITVILFALTAFVYCIIPDYIHVCHHDDPDLGNCIKNSIEALRPRLITGIPDLGVPPISPFNVDILSFYTSSSRSAHLATNITNIQVYGAEEFKLLNFSSTLNKNGNTFRFEGKIPQVYIEGQYEIDSKILILELKGKGPFHANISDYHFQCVLKGKKFQKEGETHLEFEKMKCNLIVGKIFLNLENLFEGNPLLGKATNDAINDNSEAFFEEIKPSIVDAICTKFTDIANKIISSFTYKELFP